MRNLQPVEEAITRLEEELNKLGISLKKVLVDKTLPLKYELTTGKPYDKLPKVPCDPFSSLVIADILVVGEDNERLRKHKQWQGEEYER